ncbi:MAG: hypothetical protein CVV64_11805 [Candidatus Wallbacteria bacterium HGW-Wallbacteria-1]|jgi:hypothetical protein|uniref:GPR1/FUN34/yaaH family protein n=1 Tax=Candidatus Wallbacteria bacterium HGW-Wallbacteria-1 TaxID=2013854 RepID=A0A2N1PNS8_9BACT|nr:MAG: hypothetical protein CVV64_11805 [Candidatus Wallbacteria bacterium HGW-Wallbacteria-1]
MIRKVNISSGGEVEVFGNPAPLGLLGLAISCAALVPVAFGNNAFTPEGAINPAPFATAAVFALLFGGICQLISGIMNFANRNAFGGTIFTAFAFNWFITAGTFIAVAKGWPVDHATVLATEIILFVAFIFLTYGFGFFSSTLFLFLLDIDLLYVCKIAKGFTHNPVIAAWLMKGIGVFTLLLGLIGLWLALAGLLNPVCGRPLFRIGGPLFKPSTRPAFDFGIRRAIFEYLYYHWKSSGFGEVSIEQLKAELAQKLPSAAATEVIPEILYLWEYGCLKLTLVNGDDPGKGAEVESLRLTSGGIDLYEQLILRKYEG